MVFNIAAHELKRMFLSPLAWVILAVVQFLFAMFFFILLYNFLAPSSPFAQHGLTEIVVAGSLQIAGLILLLVTPLLTMRLFSEEQASGTINLLLSSPISITELVLGKYLSVVAFFWGMLVMLALLPLSMLLGTSLDLGQLGAGLLGLALLMAALAAIGMFMSTLTQQPAVAAVSTFGVIFLLWIIHLASNTGGEQFVAIFTYLSLLHHYNSLLGGLFNSVDVIYYLLVSLTFVVLSICYLDAKRTHH